MSLLLIKGYYFITNAGLSIAGNISDVKNAIKAGVSVVQYRNKTGTTKEIIEEALQIKKIIRRGLTPHRGSNPLKPIFLINDRIDIALAVKADGVHLGQDDMSYKQARKLLGKNKIIGISTNNLKEAMAAEKAGANYIGVGPIFPTSTKKDARKPCGVSLIAEVKKVCKIPVVAIGGINHDNAREVVDAGADAVCAISAVVGGEDVKKEINKFQGLF